MSIVVTAIVKLTTLQGVQASIEGGAELPQVIKDNILAQVAGLYRDFTYLGETYTCLDNILPSEAAIPIIIAAFPDAVIVGAWDFDTGDIVKPIDTALYLEIMPDDVVYTYDELGEITNVVNSRPTVMKDIALYDSQAERKFS